MLPPIFIDCGPMLVSIPSPLSCGRLIGTHGTSPISTFEVDGSVRPLPRPQYLPNFLEFDELTARSSQLPLRPNFRAHLQRSSSSLQRNDERDVKLYVRLHLPDAGIMMRGNP